MFRQLLRLSLWVLAFVLFAPLAAVGQSDEDAGFVPVTDARPIVADGKVVSGRSCMPAGGPDACVITSHDPDTGEARLREPPGLMGTTLCWNRSRRGRCSG